MDQNIFIEELLSIAKTKGVEAEVFAQSVEFFQASAAEGALERYEVSKSGGLTLRVNVDGRSGYAYTERSEDAAILVERAIDNAKSVESEDEHPMQEPGDYEAMVRTRLKLEDMTEEERIALALRMEKKALARDPRVKRVGECDVGVSSSITTIRNSKGLHAARQGAFAFSMVTPVVEEADKVQAGFAFRLMQEAADIDGCVQEAVAQAIDKLQAKPVPSGTYRVIIENLAMAAMLEAFAPMFSADEAQKGCSLLAEREGQTIGAGCVTIIDDPFHTIAPRPFDDEGTPCQKKLVVDKGVFKTLLHNLKTAKKAGVESTGNASRPTLWAPIGAAPSVFYIQPGEMEAPALQEKLGDGLIITDLMGLHAGLSPISGDFSLKADGKLVKNGKVVQVVEGITVAGNFLTMLQAVEAVADDLKFTLPDSCYCAAPSLLVSALTIAGE